MKPLTTLLLLGLSGAFAGASQAQLQLIPAGEPPHVFGGMSQSFEVVWQNSASIEFSADVRMELIQTSSTTAASLGQWPWKSLQILAGQTIIEHATVDIPTVNAKTRFLIKWIDATNHTLGTTVLLAYPTNLLAELKSMANGDQPFGIFDPGNTLKPLIKALSVEFENMEETGIARFRGKLAIVGPFDKREQSPADMRERIEKLARNSTGVVWIQPPLSQNDKLLPSFEAVPVERGIVVVAQPQLVERLDHNPQSQLNLIHLCRAALYPVPSHLPESTH